MGDTGQGAALLTVAYLAHGSGSLELAVYDAPSLGF
jgi:hypothetical protein